MASLFESDILTQLTEFRSKRWQTSRGEDVVEVELKNKGRAGAWWGDIYTEGEKAACYLFMAGRESERCGR